MSLINCPECKKEVSDKANSCPNCGFSIADYVNKSDENKQIICQFCESANEIGSIYCSYCGKMIDIYEIQRRIQLENLRMQHDNNSLQTKQFSVQQMQLNKQQQKQQQEEYKSMARCPRCGSTSLSANKKGFGIGKAIVGMAIAGPLGLMAGNFGSKKVRVTCLKCGKQFWA